MANMTRAQMRTELQAHGWSRFQAAELDRYLDWGLQDTYAGGSFDRSVRDDATVPGVTTDQITFATISGSASELVQSVRSVLVKELDGRPRKLRYASEGYFDNIIRPNMENSTNPVKGLPLYYAVYDGNVVLYPFPDVARDVIVDFMRRKDSFSGDGDTTGLPERFDKIVLMFAEAYCHGRAREVQEQINVERRARQAMLDQLGLEESEAGESYTRVTPWGE